MLLILGNGFDLQCGLKSDYESFFSNRFDKDIFKKFKIILSNFKSVEKLEVSNFIKSYQDDFFKVITIWDMAFIHESILNGKNGEWHNIEALIRTYINENKLSYNAIKNSSIDKPSRDDNVKNLNILQLVIKVLFEELNLTFSPIQYNQWLLAQLNILEQEFVNYLKAELNRLYSYNEKAQNLFEKLYEDINYKAISVLSFNYTKPKLRYTNIYRDKVSVSNFSNVHGTINGKIIFGIDEKDLANKLYISPSETKYSFTKTSRKFMNFVKESNFNLNKNENYIMFFGHSLNEQDYSYFQSIFDFYSIYSSNVKMCFVYYNYDKKRKIKANTVDNVIKLLKEYGSTMQNKDHGSNLLHKLLLENRLIIKELII